MREMMFNNINFDFMAAMNPLYVLPIVAVLLCAIIIYAFGFKSSPQPPSFDSIEVSKKQNKKRKAKETSKAKNVITEKLEAKPKTSSSGKKKGAQEKQAPAAEKLNVNSNKMTVDDEKPSPNIAKVEKKASKKARNEKKKSQTSLSYEDENDDGWVQSLSKKARKNRRKDEANAIGNDSNTAKKEPSKPSELKSENKQNLDLAKQTETLNSILLAADSSKQLVNSEENVNKPTSINLDFGKDELASEDAEIFIMEGPLEENFEVNQRKQVQEKLQVIQLDTDLEKNVEEKVKGKKKKNKKKTTKMDKDETPKELESQIEVLPESPPVVEEILVELDTPPTKSQVVIDNIIPEQVAEVKRSNVAFDELEGLYPKEPRKKKRVRRDN